VAETVDKWDQAYTAMECKVIAAVKASGQRKVRVQYSAYESDADDTPIDNLDKIAARGKIVLVKAGDEFWGGPKAKDYRSPVLENPTWLQVCVHANEMMKVTRDLHHCFLEGLYKKRKEGDVTVYEFAMGS
jgi:hypothetical protein